MKAHTLRWFGGGGAVIVLAGAAVLGPWSSREIQRDRAAVQAISNDAAPRASDTRSLAYANAAAQPAAVAGAVESSVPTATAALPSDERPSAHSKLEGVWAGTMMVGASPVQFRFEFAVSGDRVVGKATFPLGEGRIEDGRIDTNRVAFTTRHQTTAGQPLISRFAGALANDETLELTMETEGVAGNLVAARVSSPRRN